MSHSRNVDNEVNAPSQMRDVILWGCAAVVAATTAISSYVAQSDFKFPKIASLIVDQNIVEPEIASINKPEFDNITTGSIPPKNTDKTSSNSANNGQAESFGTTIVSRQQNADAVRRMQSQGDAQNSDNTPVISATDTKIGQGPIGIDLGSGHSFSVLGKRYSALVNAAPTLFNNLSARASIVEHETSIEAHLVVGPFKDLQAAQVLCEKLQLRVNTSCKPTNYTGRKLKLY